jgi:SAM-dependent methyltransferase
VPLSPIDAHGLWAPTYDAAPNPLLDLELRSLSAKLAPWNYSRVADLACGTGRWMSFAASKGARVFGVDLCRPMLERAASKSALSSRLIHATADSSALASASFDLVLCSFAVGFFAEPANLIREMVRLAVPGGRIVLSDMHPDALAAGWKRTFRADDALHEIGHTPYSESHLLGLAASAGLLLSHTYSFSFGPRDRSTFRRIGKLHLYEAAAGLPAVWAAIWRKPSP